MCFISPMLLATREEPYNSPLVIHEPKIDGHRLIYSNEGGSDRLYTRHANEVSNKYPELWNGFEDEVVLDGEVAQVDPSTGEISFEALMERFHVQQERRIAAASKKHPVNFIAFDILRYRGKDLRSEPLMKRKEILAKLPIGNPNISVIPFVENDGIPLFEMVKARGWEGTVSKTKNGCYHASKRVKFWEKLIAWTYVDVFIQAYRVSEFGWLCAIPEADDLRPAGLIEFGVHPDQKREFNKVKRHIALREKGDFVYVQPVLKARVKTRNFTRNGMLRSPVFVEFLPLTS